jgi:NAD(P)-dependent dehydrogenase (short-subunit alcohol dehydrogenase family)
MGRIVLVSDVQTPLGEELARRYLAEGASVAVTRSNRQSRESPMVSESDGFLLTDWNRRSPISARNVLLSVTNRFGRLDEAVVLHDPTVKPALIPDTAYETIERAVDSWLKGTLFLVKGLLEILAQTGAGRLALVEYAPRGVSPLSRQAVASRPPLEAALRGAFRALVQSLLETGGPKGVTVNAFESVATLARDFAGFIVETLMARGDKPAGKWLRFQPRSGLLAPLRGLMGS